MVTVFGKTPITSEERAGEVVRTLQHMIYGKRN